MQKNLSETLKKLSFNESEAKIYLFLLEYGIATPSTISKHTNILRTNTYGVLTNLIEKGVIQEQKQNNKNAYVAKHPDTLISLIEQQKKLVELELVPELIGRYRSQKSKPIVKFYTGDDAIKEVFTQMYDAEESIYGITSTSTLFAHFGDFFKTWRKELKRRGIFLKDILTESSRSVTETQTKPDLDVFVDYRFLPESYNALNVDILIWNGNVAIFTITEPYIGMVIENNDIADAFRILHKVMWSSLKR
ncbi:MAG: hypothetical protein RL150_110 [Candidatus Parcubacteria bacterium]|jgi:sugar-specific transcriptional regulator TrmB